MSFELEREGEVLTNLEIPAKVVLYNDEWHTFEEVINQLIKALKCDIYTAESITIEVHNKGKAIVFEGDLEDALKVSSILEEIDLSTEIFI